MRIYTALTDAQIERILRTTPTSCETLVTIYSDDGIFEIRKKLHKVCIVDAPCETITENGREFRIDPSIRTLHERWQIPLPHDAEEAVVSTYQLTPLVSLICEQNDKTTYYFEANTYRDVSEWLNLIN